MTRTLADIITEHASSDYGMFRAQLLKEDLARLKRLGTLVEEAADRDDFVKQALYAGWTANDMRTYELKPALEPLLTVLYEIETSAGSTGEEVAAERLREAWRRFDALRMERLVGCLTRVPRPPGMR